MSMFAHITPDVRREAEFVKEGAAVTLVAFISLVLGAAAVDAERLIVNTVAFASGLGRPGASLR